MSVLHTLPVLWSQAVPPALSRWFSTIMWFYVWGEPAATIPGLKGAFLTWVKVAGLFCLLGWIAGWVVAAIKERAGRRGNWLDILALVAVIGGALSVLLRVLEATQRLPTYSVLGYPVAGVIAIVSGVVVLIWIEKALWASILRLGNVVDLYVLAGMHLALGAGIGVGFLMLQEIPDIRDWQTALMQGARLGVTYMGFVALALVVVLLTREAVAIRWRRLYAIAWQTVVEANRRMWAPWVVITIFLVILAFTHWFLRPQERTAELGRLYVGTLTLLASLLLTVMVALLTPLSLPYDIQQQTIYTVVSKPVRRIELIWGRMLGFMTIVTALLLLFGGISLIYLYRTVHGAIVATEVAAQKAGEQNRPQRQKQLQEEAEQLRTRMTARVPVKGSLTFIDSRGKAQIRGIDVGQELEFRSHVEGATQSMGIWSFGMVPDPIDQKIAETELSHPVHILDRRVPVDRLLRPNTIESMMNRIAELRYDELAAEARQRQPGLPSSEATRLTNEMAQKREQRTRLMGEYERMRAQANKLDTQAAEAEKAGKREESASLRSQAAALHSPPIPLEMTFTVYRTTKGVLGQPVTASLKVINPHTGDEYIAPFAVKEYYTNKQGIPASILAGSRGDLRIEVQCITPMQYLGMAESDLFILAQSDNFGANFMKGFFGIWLQAMVLTAIGVWAGTFLSWPVALLTTIAFFVAGEVAFGFLQNFALQSVKMEGGGPFESFIRLLTHFNLQNELTPTLSVVVAKTLDLIVMPIMARLVYVVPNFSALDVSNTVADGFAVEWRMILDHSLLALAYALPFSIAGYFILKHREVAA
jgi:hypothetical protein